MARMFLNSSVTVKPSTLSSKFFFFLFRRKVNLSVFKLLFCIFKIFSVYPNNFPQANLDIFQMRVKPREGN